MHRTALKSIALPSVLVAMAGAPAGAQLINNAVVNSVTEAEAGASYLPTGGDDEFDLAMDDDEALSFAEFPIDAEAEAATSASDASADADIDGVFNGSDTITVTGNASASAQGASTEASAEGAANAVFSLTFEIFQSVSYTLDWAVSAGGDGGEIGVSDIALRDGEDTLFAVEAQDVGNDGAATVTGDLGPGVYSISAGASGSGFASPINAGNSASAFFGFTFTVVPAPGAATVLALTGVAAIRRRR